MPGTNYPGRENITPETKPQPHPATGVPEQNPRPIGPATSKPQTERTQPGKDG
jgi:hypothetical protein